MSFTANAANVCDNQEKYDNNDYSTRNIQHDERRIRHVESDGYVWYELRGSKYAQAIENANGKVIFTSAQYGVIRYDEDMKCFYVHSRFQNGYEGAISRSGNWIIPFSREYENIFSSNGRYYVKKQGCEGICDANGREIITPDKYESVSWYEEDGVYYVTKNGYTGVCNRNGKEFIAPDRYENVIYYNGQFEGKVDGSYVPLNIGINGNTTDIVEAETTKGVPFKLKYGKYYKIGYMEILDGEYLPMEGEIYMSKNANGSYTFMYALGSGNGEVETLKVYRVTHYKDNKESSVYHLEGFLSQEGETGALVLSYSAKYDIVVTTILRKFNGSEYTSNFIMSPVPYDSPILKRQ